MKKYVLTILLAIPFGIQANAYINQIVKKDFNKELTAIKGKGASNENQAYADLQLLETELKAEQKAELQRQSSGVLGCLWKIARFTLGATPSDNEKALTSALSQIEICRAEINIARAISNYNQRLDMAYRVFKGLAIVGIAAAIYNREMIATNLIDLLSKISMPNIRSYFS